MGEPEMYEGVEVRNQLKSIYDRLMKEAERLARLEPQDRIFHYTRSVGLEGILHDRSIRATNTNFLNDTSEMSYGINMVSEIIDENIRSSDNDMRSYRSILNRDESTPS